MKGHHYLFIISEAAHLNASLLRKAHNKPGGADKSCFPAFQKASSKNLTRGFLKKNSVPAI